MFQGFSDETIRFLWELKLNNERPWFNAHKQTYLDRLSRPMNELGHEAYDALMERCPGLRGNLKITRIYRDARRIHHGGPYKDHLWLSVEPPHDSDRDWHGIPALWFEVSTEGYDYGFGYWGRPSDMATFRALLGENPQPFERLVRRFRRQSVFQLEGERYRRPKGESTPLLAPWYNRKHIALVSHNAPDDTFRSPALVERLVSGWAELADFYRWFDEVLNSRTV